jgi:hypothetical protein
VNIKEDMEELRLVMNKSDEELLQILKGSD